LWCKDTNKNPNCYEIIGDNFNSWRGFLKVGKKGKVIISKKSGSKKQAYYLYICSQLKGDEKKAPGRRS
jgi:hypothetical protein